MADKEQLLKRNCWGKSAHTLLYCEPYEGYNSKFLLKVGLSPLRKFFAKSKFPSALFEKIPSFVCLVFKMENKYILILPNLFS